MRVLILGDDSREHALAWKLKQESSVEKLFAGPGNSGLAQESELIDIDITDFAGVNKFSTEKEIDLIIADNPRYCRQGLVDRLKQQGFLVLGPGDRALELDNNNLQKRRFLLNQNIPAVDCGIFSSAENARKYLEEADYPLQIRPAQNFSSSSANQSGQPVSAADRQEAETVIKRFLSEPSEEQYKEESSSASSPAEILIEEIPAGERLSVFAISDGNNLMPFSSARIERAVFAGGEGAITPGMGAYSPLPAVSFQVDKLIYRDIMLPLQEGLKQRGITHQGFMAAEIVITDRGPKIVDFQLNLPPVAAATIIPRLDGSLQQIITQAAAGEIKQQRVSWSQKTAVSVVVTSGGYPLMHKKGFPIKGLDQITEEDTRIFHISTRSEEDDIVTDGGRVLVVTALAAGHFAAVDKVNSSLQKIDFQDIHYRTDIGAGAILDLSQDLLSAEEQQEQPREQEEGFFRQRGKEWE